MSKVKIPRDYHSITPYITVKGGDAAIEFYKKKRLVLKYVVT